MEPYEILEEDDQSREEKSLHNVSGSLAEKEEVSKDEVQVSISEPESSPAYPSTGVPFAADISPRKEVGKRESFSRAVLFVSKDTPLISSDASDDESDDGGTQLFSGRSDGESKNASGFVFLPKSALEFGFGTSSSDSPIVDDKEHESAKPQNPNGIAESPLLHEEREGSVASQEEDSSLLEKENQAFSLENEESGSSMSKSDKSSIFSDQPIGKESLLKKSQAVKDMDKVPLLLPSPARTDVSSEEESTMMSTSMELDSLRSPGLASDGEGEDQGVCSKYSQLSEDGSSPSSNLKSDVDHPGSRKDQIVFEHSLELGVAFSEYVDVDSFKASLGSRNPHTEDGFGGKSEEHILVLLKAGSFNNLKTYLRQCQWPAESDSRHKLWENACLHLLKAGGNLYEDLANERFGKIGGGVSSDGDEDIPFPAFVDPRHTYHHHLNRAGVTITKKVIDVIGHFDPDVLYCPLLFPLASTFLHYMGPNSCFNCMQALLRSADPTYIHQTKSGNDAIVYVLKDLAKKYTKQAYTLIVRSSKAPESVFEHWIFWLFRDLPFQYLVRILDCFLIEGYKVLYRTVLAIIYLFAKDTGKKGNRNSPVSNIHEAISRYCVNIPIEPQRLLKVGFRIRGLTRKEIVKLQLKHQAYVKNFPTKDDIPTIGSYSNLAQHGLARSHSGPVVLQCSAASVLTQDMLQTLWSWIPHRFTLKKLVQLYTSEEHGTSLRTLFFKSEHVEQTLLVIKSTNDEVFGAYCSASWYERHERNKPNTGFFGNGETFIFTLVPSERKFAWAGLNPNAHSTADYFMAGDDTRLVVGGGGGEAIELDGMMNHCRTSHCDTFDNEPLCSMEDFSCRVVEVYGFVD